MNFSHELRSHYLMIKVLTLFVIIENNNSIITIEVIESEWSAGDVCPQVSEEVLDLIKQ